MSLLNETPKRRKSDQRPIVCKLTEFWDWVDKRDMDKHAVSVGIFIGTIKLTVWACNYAMNSDRPGSDVALIIAAVTAPYVALQAAALKFYFESRSSGK